MALLFVVLAFAATAPAGAAGARFRDEVFPSVTVTYGLPYATVTNASGQQQTLALDLFEPAGDTASLRPTIAFAHGGGFTGGRRDDPGIVGLATTFAKRGYVTASISYRIRPPGTPGSPTMQDLIVGSLAGELPGAMHDAQRDMQAAVRWLRDNYLTYRIDTGFIIAGGVSAGASMALETAYNPHDDGDAGTTTSEVRAALSISGATDPRRIEHGAPPVALFNGTNDTTAPYLTAVMACAGAHANFSVCELTTYPGAGHDLGAHGADIVARSADFLCRRLLGGC